MNQINSKIDCFYKNKFPLLITFGFFISMSYIAFFHHPIWHEADGIYYLNYGRAILEGSGNDVQIVNGQIGAPILFASLDSIFHDAFSGPRMRSLLISFNIFLTSGYDLSVCIAFFIMVYASTTLPWIRWIDAKWR